MATSRYLFTSESVTEGHPDKVCDQISDAILDAFLMRDPKARVAAETLATTGMVLVTGEITSSTYVDIPGIARQVIEDIGYVGEKGGGFDGRTCGVLTSIDEQSADIAGGVNQAKEVRDQLTSDEIDQIGAGDQGIMFGYACNETDALMPLPIQLAHALVHRLAEVRKKGILGYLRPDGKSQVTVEYVAGRPSRIDTIVISTQHDPEIPGCADNEAVQARIAADLHQQVILPVFQGYAVQPDAQTRLLINPSGRFVIGGPQGDCGLTGRKIIVDTYGGYSRHGGGAFSGKDPTKVDRSAAYAARYVAKNIVASGLADRCEVQIGYAIGVARPVSVNINTFGTASLTDDEIAELVNQHFDLRPAAIIQSFDLTGLPARRNGRFYRDLAAYGHVGRTDLNLPWEQTDKAEQLREASARFFGQTERTMVSAG
ncbi:MAG: methionine adenosyltransferase [Candidatus Melainabacteria bacterium]|nr:methionine adenosyltransferase [Candidatus Melainabacteria bacterium]